MSDRRAPGRQLHLGVLLSGAGHHPAAWRHPSVRAQGLFEAEGLVAQVQTAERGTLDLVITDDRFSRGDERRGRVQGRLDALLALARVAPVTTAVGLVPTVDVTHTEPFHVSKNVATLDLVSSGRAGWRASLSRTEAEARLFGRKPVATLAELTDEADEVVDVVGRLWDSWEDDAVIRDQPTGRYLDRDKVHYVDFEGRFFNVRGPLITPRPPQGQPLVVIDAVSPPTVQLAGRRADIALIAAADVDSAGQLSEELRALAAAAGRPADALTVLAVADVVFGPDSAKAAAERRVLDSLVMPDPADDRLAGSLDYVGSPIGFAGLAADWFRAEAVDGFVLRPALLPRGLDQIVDGVVPSLRASGVFRSAYTERALRHRFGLEHPPNRYAAAAGTGAGAAEAAEAAR